LNEANGQSGPLRRPSSGAGVWGGRSFPAGYTDHVNPPFAGKVWIIPERVDLNFNQTMAWIAESRLTIQQMSDPDLSSAHDPLISHHYAQAFQKHIQPYLQAEVNSSLTFGPVRQMLNAAALAYWYKHNTQHNLNVMMGDSRDTRVIGVLDPTDD
jgi:hypothetical protein